MKPQTPQEAHVRLPLAPRLPGRSPARAGLLTLIILAVAAALWFYVFPWASLHLPIDSSGFTG